MYEYTEAELLDIISNAITFGLTIGIIVGIILGVGLIYLMIWSNNRNFKQWLLQIKEDKRKLIIEEIDTILVSVDEIVSSSNAKMFKGMYNRLNSLKSYIAKKYMQN